MRRVSTSPSETPLTTKCGHKATTTRTRFGSLAIGSSTSVSLIGSLNLSLTQAPPA
jgi:hypothetical protein